MLRLPSAVSAAVLASMVAVASCSWNPFASDGCELDVCDARVEVAVSPREIVPGDTARITVTAANPTDRTLHVSGMDCPITYEIETDAGEPVDRHTSCITGSWTIDLAPGQVLESTFDWTGEKLDASGRVSVPLPAGEYRVRGNFAGIDSRSSEMRLLPAAE